MGVKGLTTFLYTRQKHFFVDCKLHDTTIIIDGNSLAVFVYNFHEVTNASGFGGNYDVYGFYIEKTFELFKSCNIYPVVVFDGGVEMIKYRTTCTRHSDSVKKIIRVYPGSNCYDCFPLLMRHAFKQKLISLNITVLQSDFEADKAIASVSKLLNKAPVLSNDSDFFIYDVPYIPLDSVNLRKVTKLPGRSKVKFISAQLFSKKNFLSKYHIKQNLLCLLGILLGNDYISKMEFQKFFLRGTSTKRKYPVGDSIKWLNKHHSVDSAIEEMVSYYESDKREEKRKLLLEFANVYTITTDTYLLDYIPEDIKLKAVNNELDIDDDNSSDSYEEDDLSDSPEKSTSFLEPDCDANIEDKPALHSLPTEHREGASSSEESKTTDFEENFNNKMDVCESFDSDSVNVISLNCEENVEMKPILYKSSKQTQDLLNEMPDWFLKLARRGHIPPCVMTFFSVKSYFTCSQPECYSLKHSANIGLPLLKFISGLLLGNTNIQYWYRCQHTHYKYQIISTTKLNMNYKNSFYLPLNEREKIIIEAFKYESKLLDSFPEEWKLFALAFNFWVKSSYYLKQIHFHAVIMMLIAVGTIKSKLSKAINKKFIDKNLNNIKDLISSRKKEAFDPEINMTIIEAKEKVLVDDCLIGIWKLFTYFESKHKDTFVSQSYSTHLIHPFAELQVCIEKALILNSILGLPFKTLDVTTLFNGTFLYNFAAELKINDDLLKCVRKCFALTPSLLTLYYTIMQSFSFDKLKCEPIKPKQKVKKQKVKPPQISEKYSDTSEDEPFVDVNNKFALLTKQRL